MQNAYFWLVNNRRCANPGRSNNIFERNRWSCTRFRVCVLSCRTLTVHLFMFTALRNATYLHWNALTFYSNLIHSQGEWDKVQYNEVINLRGCLKPRPRFLQNNTLTVAISIVHKYTYIGSLLICFGFTNYLTIKVITITAQCTDMATSRTLSNQLFKMMSDWVESCFILSAYMLCTSDSSEAS